MSIISSSYFSLPGSGSSNYAYGGSTTYAVGGQDASVFPAGNTSSFYAPVLFVPQGTYHFIQDLPGLTSANTITATNLGFGSNPAIPCYCYYLFPCVFSAGSVQDLPFADGTLDLNVNQALTAVYFNGTLVSSPTGIPPGGLPLLGIVIPSGLICNGPNTLAIVTELGVGGDTGQTCMQYLLNLTTIAQPFPTVKQTPAFPLNACFQPLRIRQCLPMSSPAPYELQKGQVFFI